MAPPPCTSESKAHFPGVHVILMTGYTEQLESIARLGFEIVPKPCSAEILAQAITRMGPERRQRPDATHNGA